MARTKVSPAVWQGVVETLPISIALSAQKCGTSWSLVKKMRMILYGKMNPNNRMRPPEEILTRIPYTNPSLNREIRAVTQAEITQVADKAARINEMAPVTTKRVKMNTEKRVKMNTELFRIIALHPFETHGELGKRLGLALNTVSRWRRILSGEQAPGPGQLKKVSRSSIYKIRQEFGLSQRENNVVAKAAVAMGATIIEPPLGLPENYKQLASEAISQMKNEETPEEQAQWVMNMLLILAERMEKLVPAFAEAQKATERIENIKANLGL